MGSLTAEGPIAKISTIEKTTDGSVDTQETSLRRQGHTRFPGTKRMLFPYKELDGKYRTGLDENARYLNNIPDPTIRQQEKDRIKNKRIELEEALGISLSPTSDYYKTHIAPKENGELKATGIQLKDGDNIFKLTVAAEAVTYAWVSVHPAIAPSLEAYNRGDVPADTQFFVNDETFEAQVTYNKKKAMNDAIVKLDSLSLERRRKVGRLLDLPITEDTREEVAYNMLDSFLKKPEIEYGVHKGSDPVRIFTMYVTLEDNVLDVKDLVEQAFKHQIYRIKKGKVYEGEQISFESKEELVDHLLDISNQADRLALDSKLRVKKSTLV